MSKPNRQPLPISDARREASIRAAAAQMAKAYEANGNCVSARAALHVMTALISERSPEQVRRMEGAAGLSAGRGEEQNERGVA